jgi:hypothetical protein
MRRIEIILIKFVQNYLYSQNFVRILLKHKRLIRLKNYKNCILSKHETIFN